MLYISYKLMLMESSIIDKQCLTDQDRHMTFLFLHVTDLYGITIAFVLQNGSVVWSYFEATIVTILYMGHTSI